VSLAKRLVPAFVVILLLVLATGWLITHPWRGVTGFDNDLALSLEDHRTSLGNTLTEIGAFIGSTWVFLVGSVVLTGLLAWRAGRRPAIFAFSATAGVLVIYLAATQTISRQRPPVHILDPGLVPDHSFPSGHTLFATALYGVLVVLLWNRQRWAACLLALLPLVVGVSRLYEGAHHLTDVLTSLVAATIWLVVLARVVVVDPVRD
jgi:membrane-associated phospholipid phosphatase